MPLYRVLLPIPEQGLFTPPINSIIVNGLIDYLTSDAPPVDALYVMEMRGPGEFAIVKPLPTEIQEPDHVWQGWPQLYRV